jgi:hypothetical protein
MKVANSRHELILGIGVIVFLLFAAFGTGQPQLQKFDSVKWKSNVFVRYTMADDLTANTLKVGKPLNEVKQLLGEPDFARTEQGRQVLTYLFDPVSSTIRKGLIIVFDKSEKLSSTAVPFGD